MSDSGETTASGGDGPHTASVVNSGAALGKALDAALAQTESVSSGSVEVPDEAAPTGVSTFDWRAHGDQLVEVTYGGEQIQVPLVEAINGGLRQRDYTRQTQELAQQRQELSGLAQVSDQAQSLYQMMQSDPAGTARRILDHFGEDADDDDEFDEYGQTDSKTTRRVEALEGELRSMRDNASQDQHWREQFDALRHRYGSNVDGVEVARHMAATGISDPAVAYRDMNYDDAVVTLHSRKAGSADAKQRRAASQSAVSTRSQSGAFNNQSTPQTLSEILDLPEMAQFLA